MNLPAKPDAQTGEPRPPEAPVEPNRGKEAAPKPYVSKVAGPPEGGGPPLEWEYSDRTAFRGMSIFSALITLFVGVGKLGFAAFTNWFIWALVLAFAAIGYLLPRGQRMSAGADWLNDRGAIVRTYELDSIDVSGYAGGWNLELRDKHGGVVDTTLGRIQHNRKLWDLVYNGIRNSVADGAKTNTLARKKLQLNESQHKPEAAG